MAFPPFREFGFEYSAPAKGCKPSALRSRNFASQAGPLVRRAQKLVNRCRRIKSLGVAQDFGTTDFHVEAIGTHAVWSPFPTGERSSWSNGRKCSTRLNAWSYCK